MSGQHSADYDAGLTDAEWRAFQAIPEQGYSHRAWLDHLIRERMAEARRTHVRDVRAHVEALTRWAVPPGYAGVIVQSEIRNPEPVAMVRWEDLRAALTSPIPPGTGDPA